MLVAMVVPLHGDMTSQPNSHTARCSPHVLSLVVNANRGRRGKTKQDEEKIKRENDNKRGRVTLALSIY